MKDNTTIVHITGKCQEDFELKKVIQKLDGAVMLVVADLTPTGELLDEAIELYKVLNKISVSMIYVGKIQKLVDKELYRLAYPRWDKRYNRPRILIDMDDCINNFLAHLCKIYNKRLGTNIKPSQIKSWDLTQVMGKEALEIFQEEGFFLNVPEKKKSTSALKELIESTLFDVYIITACTSSKELTEKIEWLHRLLPNFNPNRVIRCNEKEIIRGDVLIDDKVANLEACEPYMKCILFDMPHNRTCNKYPRIKSLKEAIPLLYEWFYEETLDPLI